jgi:DMSO/TMAO reductase YedYZ molybdopterin-dependent catalytic subunit
MTAPPGPFRPTFWRSPLRGPWLTSALGSVLLLFLSIVIVTGFLSHVAYEPNLRGNAIVPAGADLPLLFSWPTGPTYLYGVTQGLHVNVGLAAVPLLLAKLWSVIPRLWLWPPAASLAQGRLSIALLVSSAVFQFATGIMNAQYWYAFGFNFVVAHYYGAVIFTAALALHVLLKAPVILRAYRERGWLRPLRADLRHTRPEPPDEHGELSPVAPAPPTISRRGLFAFVRSLQPRGVLSKASLNGDQVRDPDAMLALKVNGADLPLDHGFPARIIVPALPGVHNTKWVASIDFGTVA